MIKVLRLGHRTGRDDRISTHVGLAARQWGASGIIYSGERDESMMESLRDTVERWGGSFTVEYREDWRNVIEEFDGTVVHLSMYSEPVGEVMEQVEEDAESEDLLIVVGAEKVPREVYLMADHNVAVGNQPHSEVSALAVFLDRLRGIKGGFEGADIEVIPSEEEKLTRDKD